MINAILIDDEVHCLDTLNILLSDYCPEVQVMEQYISAKKATDAPLINSNLIWYSSILKCRHINGFKMLEQFNEIPFLVIFTTSYDQYAIKAIRFSALIIYLNPLKQKNWSWPYKNPTKNVPSTEQLKC